MENKGFEKKTSEIMQGFKLNPSEAVWQNVARTIRKRKRRRFFAWLFPAMLLAGGGIGWLIFFQSPGTDKVTDMNNRILSMKKDEGQDSRITDGLLAASHDSPSIKKIKKTISLADWNTRINQRPQMSGQEKNADPIAGSNIHKAIPKPTPKTNGPTKEKTWTERGNLPITAPDDLEGTILDVKTDTTGKPAPTEDRYASLEKPGQIAAGPSTTTPPDIQPTQKRKTRWSVNIAAGTTMLRSRGQSKNNGLAIEAGIIRSHNAVEKKFNLSYGLSIGQYKTEGFKKSGNDLLLSGGSMNASQPGANPTGQDAMDRRQAIAMMSVPIDLHMRLGKKGRRPAHLHTGLWNGYIISSGLKHADPVTGVSEPDMSMHNRLQTCLEAGFSTGMLRKKGYPLTLSIQYRHGLSGIWKQQASMEQKKLSLLTARMSWEFGRSHPSSTMNTTPTR
jgi:hypothetical protein